MEELIKKIVDGTEPDETYKAQTERIKKFLDKEFGNNKYLCHVVFPEKQENNNVKTRMLMVTNLDVPSFNTAKILIGAMGVQTDQMTKANLGFQITPDQTKKPDDRSVG